jgi:hypothetical protein
MPKVDPLTGWLEVRSEKHGDIAEIEEVKKMLGTPMEVEYRRKEHKSEENRVEEREDSKSTASIEVFDFMFDLRGVEEDAGDEEAGEDEEEVDSYPACISDRAPETKDGVCSFVASGEVVKHDGENGDSTKTIKRSVMPAGASRTRGAGRIAYVGGGELRDCHHRHS